MAETSRFKIPELASSELVSEGPSKINSALTAIDNINEGHQDFLQAGVVESTDWSFTAAINSSTGTLSSEASTGGKAWLPDPVLSGALMRSVTTSAVLSGLTPSTLPTSGKYMTIGFELAPTTWGEKAAVSVKSGTEYGTEAEADAHSPAISSGKIRVRDVIVKNTAGVYSIVKQIERRLWATGGEAKTETVAEGKIGKEAVTGPKLGSGTIRLLSGATYSALTARSVGTEYEASATRTVYVKLILGGGPGSFAARVTVGGVLVGEYALTASEIVTESFFCPPGVKWKAAGTGVGELSKLESSYLIL